jgi:hypothetical protein
VAPAHILIMPYAGLIRASIPREDGAAAGRQ